MVMLEVPTIVSAPASRPRDASWPRSLTTSSTIAAGVAPGRKPGRRDRGSNAASPSAR